MIFCMVIAVSCLTWLWHVWLRKPNELPPWRSSSSNSNNNNGYFENIKNPSSGNKQDDHQDEVAQDINEQQQAPSPYTEIDKDVVNTNDNNHVTHRDHQNQHLVTTSTTEHLLPSEHLRSSMVIPIVIFAYTRTEYLKRCLDNLFQVLEQQQKQVPNLPQFDIFVSQDGDFQGIIDLVQSYGKNLKYVQHNRAHVQFDEPPIGGRQYYYISQHYKFGIEQVFRHSAKYDRIIILEEDIQVAPDFFDYFASLGVLLDSDPTLFCISGWNDNGMKGFVRNTRMIYRSDFFPGLGWMMKRDYWDSIHDKWPLGFWDDWLRLPHVRKGKACIRPEISRTFTFGEQGASGGQFYQQFLSRIELSNDRVAWSERDMSDMIKSHYDTELHNYLSKVPLVHVDRVMDNSALATETLAEVKISYASEQHFVELASKFGVMTESKAGVPRTAYLGIVTFWYRVYLVPERDNLLYSNDKHN